MGQYDAKQLIQNDFDKTWNHYDVLAEDKLVVSQIVPFFQMLKQDTSLQLHLNPPAADECDTYKLSPEVCKYFKK